MTPRHHGAILKQSFQTSKSVVLFLTRIVSTPSLMTTVKAKLNVTSLLIIISTSTSGLQDSLNAPTLTQSFMSSSFVRKTSMS